MRKIPHFKSINGDNAPENIKRDDNKNRGDVRSIYDNVIDWLNSDMGEIFLAILTAIFLLFTLGPLLAKVIKIIFIDSAKIRIRLE